MSGMTKNIVWFQIDSLRPDFLRINGDKDAEENFFDKLLKRGVFFSNCISAAAYTIASENSLFTGLYPNIHKVDGWFKTVPDNMSRNVVTLMDILKQKGYFTASFYACPTRAYMPPYSLDMYELLDDDRNFPLKEYITAKSPKFLFLGLSDVHDSCCQNQGTFTKKKYREAVKKVADKVESFYAQCCSKDDVIVIASDHGVRCIEEPAGSHSEFITGRYLTDKTIKVLFSIVAPDILPEGKRIDAMVRTIDLVPTLLDVTGLPVLRAQGVSLSSVIYGTAKCEELVQHALSQTGGMVSSPWRPDMWSIRTPKWKFVLTLKRKTFGKTYRKELFNLENDKDELFDVVDEYPDIAQMLEKMIFEELINNDASPEMIYRKKGFEYKKFLATRTYPLNVRWKIFLRNFIYKNIKRTKVRLMLFAKRFFSEM